MALKQNIVYFLGAGSSYNFGYPLTSNIMPDILAGLKAGNLFTSAWDNIANENANGQKELLDYIEMMYPGLMDIDPEKESERIPNITEVFSFVEHLCFSNTTFHPKMNETKLTSFRVLLSRALAELLHQYEHSKLKDAAKVELGKKFIVSIKKNCDNNAVSIITTNYDLVIDKAFSKEAFEKKIDFGIEYRDINEDVIIYTQNPLLRYYKLHGSLNWLMCNMCGRYYINPYGSIVHQEFRTTTDGQNTCFCNSHMRLKSVLVAPSTVRDIRDSNLLQIWKAAVKVISEADKLILVGYSLPAEDLAIKSIILRGLNSSKKNHKLEVDVVQFGEQAKPNYMNIFGKDNFDYEDSGLEAYLKKNNPEFFLA